MEIEKQNSVINALEREMLRLKAMYEAAVEQRNFAGVQLIDRNDELCVLYEKSNIQETTLTVSFATPQTPDHFCAWALHTLAGGGD